MSSENKAITASEFPLALFMAGLPLILASYSLSGIPAPANLPEVLATGLAVLGFLAEPFRDDRYPDAPLWVTAGIPALLITWISFSSFARLTQPLAGVLPYFMEAKPILYLLVCALWTTSFGHPDTRQISFWAGLLALLICTEFTYSFMTLGLAVEPGIFGHYSLTGPALLTGLCATLHHEKQNRLLRGLILAGTFCTLSRDYSLAAVTIILFFGSGGILKKVMLLLLLAVFSYISLIPQDMTLLNRNDLPRYWLWFSTLELLAGNPGLLLTGFPLSIPLPLSVPASLWNIWHSQQFVWVDQGLFLFHLTPFWLHLLTAWGLGGIAALTAGAAFLYRRFPSGMMAGLLCTTAIGGFFSPMLYSAPSAIIIIMALFSCTRPEVRCFKFE